MNNRPLSSHHIQPSLLVQGNSGGNSSVYQMIGMIKCGVSLTIENMISLLSDKMSKIKRTANTTVGVSSTQLGSIKRG